MTETKDPLAGVKCYVTDKAVGLNLYYFGSENHVRLALCQEAFAHFILRAGNDPMHKEIMRDIEEAIDAVADVDDRWDLTEKNTDSRIDISIERAMKMDTLTKLLTQKCESGVRILRQLKKEYERNGKFTI